MSRLAVVPDRTSAQGLTAVSAVTDPTLGGLAEPTHPEGQDPSSFADACIDDYLYRVHQEPRYADLDAGYGSSTLFYRPCVDCGQMIGCFCDYCEAQDRMPDQRWEKGQLTPLCTACDSMRGACHFCFGLCCSICPFSRPQTPSPVHGGPTPSQGKD